MISPPSLFLLSRSSAEPALLEPLAKALETVRDLDYRFFSGVSDLGAAVIASERAVLLANCLRKADIADLYNVLPRLAPRVEEGILRILVLNSIGHPRLGSLLRSRAPVEIIELPTTLKGIQYKLKAAVTSIHPAYPKAADQDVVWQPPIDFRSDVWWILGRKSIRNVVGVWLIDLLGPGPAVGAWGEVPGAERAGEKAWAWRPRESADEAFRTPSGRWTTFGKPPEFSWRTNLWSFVSKGPMLAFYADGSNAPEYVRFEYRSEVGLLFRENSAFTKGLLAKIEASFESRVGGGPDIAEELAALTGDFGDWDLPAESAAKALDPRPPRSPLAPDEASAGRLGLAAVASPGVAAGSDAFERLEIRVEALRKNGVRLDRSPEILLYEVNESGSILFLRGHPGRLGDQFVLRYHLDSGGQKMTCAMEWELTSVDLELEDGILAAGAFRSGDFDPLFILLDRLAVRKREPKDFYSAARG
jgi:hypothetical protein